METHFNTLGIMIDMSRNAVMSVDGLKKYLCIIKQFGYNTVMLYTEDTYEIDGEPFFGYMRGRYSKLEMKEIDSFAESIGVTIIPCIQTLAHLKTFLRWNKVSVDCNDIMLTDDERTYELIDKMFKTMSECFKSRKIHIGMDEAHMLGRGKHLDIYGYEKTDIIMQRHLNRVLKLAEKYGYEAMMWSDMFFRSWNDGHYHAPVGAIPQAIIDSFPQNVIPVYWDYYLIDEQGYSEMLENHKLLSNRSWFAGGAWTWYGITPFNKFTLKSMCPAIDACKKHNVKDIFFTMWGDDGGECSRFAILPALYYLAEYSKGNTDIGKIKEGFKRIMGIDYDDFIKLDLPNDIVEYTKLPKNPAKYMLYSDYFNGFLDYTAPRNVSDKYEQYANELFAIAKKSSKYGYLFDTQAKLCMLLKVKFELGLKTREAYEKNDKKELLRLVEVEYNDTIKGFKSFGRAIEKQWLRENKSQGLEIQHQRIGAMIYRTKFCRQRLLDYVNGKIQKIDELEEKLLPYGKKEMGGSYNKALFFSTANVVVH